MSNEVVKEMKEKFDKINNVIIEISEQYHYITNNFEYELNELQKTMNSLINIEDINIKELLGKQQNVIKDLVQMINSLLLNIKTQDDKMKINNNILTQKGSHLFTSLKEIKNGSDLTEAQIKKKDDSVDFKTKIIESNKIPLNILSPKNSNEFKGSKSFLNINPLSKKKKLYQQYINKKDVQYERNFENIYTKLQKKNKLSKSLSTPSMDNNFIKNNNNLYKDRNVHSKNNYNEKLKINETVNSVRKNNMYDLYFRNTIQGNNTTKNITKSSRAEFLETFQQPNPKTSANRNIDNCWYLKFNKGKTKKVNRSLSEIFTCSSLNSQLNNPGNKTCTNHNKVKDAKHLIIPSRNTGSIYFSSYNIVNKYDRKKKKSNRCLPYLHLTVI